MKSSLLEQHGKWKCPCCQYFTLPEGPAYWRICPVCAWEDDGLWDPQAHSYPNHMKLGEGRSRYSKQGCVVDHMVKWVRKPMDSEKQPTN